MHESGLFLNDWKDADNQVLIEQFAIPAAELQGIEILLASYCRDAFYGEAFVLFSRDGRLYEVNASHDSSDGMTGQWEPEETLIEALRYRLENGRLGSHEDGCNLFADELRFLLFELEADGFR
ncbi:MAG: hypothetical protein C0631_03255 [Sedimenticola sp.]|jgi:hypothetical protein|nr:MAG: hypothetical protein C0631_03255 [Sedimenticola sp.]